MSDDQDTVTVCVRLTMQRDFAERLLVWGIMGHRLDRLTGPRDHPDYNRVEDLMNQLSEALTVAPAPGYAAGDNGEPSRAPVEATGGVESAQQA